MDVRLYAAAQKMLKEARERQAAAGILVELPPAPKALQAKDSPPPLPHLPSQGDLRSKGALGPGGDSLPPAGLVGLHCPVSLVLS